MGLDGGDHPSKHGCGDDMNFIEKDKPPFARREELHHLFRFMGTIMGIGDHRVRRDNNSALPCKLRIFQSYEKRDNYMNTLSLFGLP